jgi:tetratricopeptide (TPR) repeat protein
VRPIEALAALLRSLGIPPQQIPTNETQAAALYRTTLAYRRILIVLDNACSVNQIRPLLPGSPSCLVLITSRDNLTGLVARDGAVRITLDVLPPEDARSLLAGLMGEKRAAADPGAVNDLTRACANLPLALRIAAELVAARPATPLADLVAELSDRQRRLELLDSWDDPQTTVKTVFSWSIQHLSPDALRTFRLLGLHPGPDIDTYATAALVDTSVEQAHRTLDMLSRAHLAHPTAAERYGMHDLLRAYASHLAATQEADEQRRAAMKRLLGYYLAAAAGAMDKLYPAESHRLPPIAAPTTPTRDLADPDAAITLLVTELPCLVAMAACTARSCPTYAIRLSATLYRYLDGGSYIDALAVHDYASAAAQATGDQVGQARALRSLGIINGRVGRYQLGSDQLQQALSLFRQVGDLTGAALVLNNLGNVEERLGRYRSAAGYLQEALKFFQQEGDHLNEALALNSLGNVDRRLGEYRNATDHHQRALALFRRAGDRAREASALNALGALEEQLGNYRSAADYLERALALARQLRHSLGEASVLEGLGSVNIRLGRLEKATDYLQQALALFRKIGDRAGQAWALNGLGEATLAAGKADDALAHHTAALQVAKRATTRDQQARAHTGLGQYHEALGDATLANDHYRQAINLYTDLDMPEAEEVRRQLAGLRHRSRR